MTRKKNTLDLFFFSFMETRTSTRSIRQRKSQSLTVSIHIYLVIFLNGLKISPVFSSFLHRLIDK
jgi:hypothetical protein